MILYNVTISIDPQIHDEWVEWMKNTHIPDVLSTGMFESNRMMRVHGEADELTYAIQYVSSDWDSFNKYQNQFAPALQKAHSERYDGKYVAFRTVLEIIHEQKA